MKKVILYPGANNIGKFYQSEDGQTYCVVNSGMIIHNDKAIGEALFKGDTHEDAINRGLDGSEFKAVVSFDKLWIDGKLVDSHDPRKDSIVAVKGFFGLKETPLSTICH